MATKKASSCSTRAEITADWVVKKINAKNGMSAQKKRNSDGSYTVELSYNTDTVSAADIEMATHLLADLPEV